MAVKMDTFSNHQLASYFKSFSKGISIFVVFIGCLVLLGWIFDLTSFKSVLPGLATMKVNTALGFVLCGISLWVAWDERVEGTRLRIAQTCAILAATVGLLTLSEYLSNRDFGIDQLFIREIAAREIFPGRMAPATALSFVLIGISLLFLANHWWKHWLNDSMAIAALLISVLALMGYAYGVSSLYKIGEYTSMALHTAFSFGLISIGVLFARPKRGLMAIVTSNSLGGMLTRRLTLPAIIIPILIGWLRLAGQKMELYDTGFGTALFALSTIIIFSILILWNARLVSRVDIDRKQTQEALDNSQTQVASIVTSIMDAVISINQNNTIVIFNPAAEKMFGYTADEIMGQSLDMLIPTHFRTEHQKHIDKFGQTGITNRSMINMNGYMEITGVKKNGDEFAMDTSISQIVLNGEKLFTAILRDVTERKQTATALRNIHKELELQFQQRTAALSEANTLLKTMLEYIPDQIYFKDTESRFIKNSKAQATALGLADPALAVGKTDFDFFPHAQRSFDEEQEIIRSGKPLVDFEEHVVWPDGKETWISTTKVPLHNQEGTIIGTFGISRDITERKRAEESLQKAKEELEVRVVERTAELSHANKQFELELGERKIAEAALRASEYNYRSILEQASDGIFISDASGRYIEVNPSGCAMLGYTRDELLSKKMSDLIPAEDLTAIPVRMDELKQGKIFLSERRMIRKDGTLLQVEISARMLSDGKFQGIVRDITERKLTEQKLKESEEKYRALFYNSQVGMYRSKLDGSAILAVNRKMCEIFGYSEGEMLGNPATIRWADPEARKRMVPELQRAGSLQDYEVDILTKSGQVRTCSVSAQLNIENGYLEGSFIDITERKQAEAEIRKSESKFKNLFENAPIGHSLTGIDGAISVNKAFCDILGYSEDELQAKNWKEITYPADIQESLDVIQSLLDAKISSAHFEKRYIHKSGNIIWTDVTTALQRDEDGSPLYFLTSMADITERKQAENELKESEERFSKAFYSSPVPQAIIAQETSKVMEINDANCRLFGYSRKELVDSITSKLNLWENPIERQSALEELQKTGHLLPREANVRVKAGTLRTLIAAIEPISWKGLPCFIVSMNDITERKQAEIALRESEQRLQFVLQGSQLGYWDWNLETNEVKRNKRWAEMLGYHWNDMEFTVKQWVDFIHPDDQTMAQQSIQDHIEGRSPLHRLEYRMRTKDGQYKWILDQAQVVKWDSNQRALRMSGTHTDITERKQAEETLVKNRSMLKAMGKMAKVGAWEFDVETRQQIWTNEIYRIHEVDMTYEPTVDNGIKFYAPAAQPVIEQAVQRAIEYGEPYDLELEFITAKGNHRWVHSIGNTKQENGKTKKVYGAFQDITERKLAENALQKSQERFSMAFLASPAGLVISSMEDGRIVEVNDTYLRMVEYSREEVIGHTTTELNITSMTERAKLIDQMREKGQLLNFEMKLQTKSGRAIEMLFSALQIELDGVPHLLSTTVEITERKRAEAELGQIRYILSEGQMIAHLGSWEYIADTQTTIWSEEQLRIYGLNPAGSSPDYQTMLRNHIHPDDAAGLDEAFRLCLQNHSVYEQEHRIMRPDGSVRFVQEVAHPYFDEHGKLVMYIGTTLDITNRKHAEEEIRHLNETLEQRIIERTAELSDLYNNAPCGYHSLDADGVFVHINQTELNWLGYRLEELVGKANIISLLTPASVEIFKQHFPVFKEVGLLNNLELEFMRKDGSVLPVLLSASAVRDQAGSYVESRTTLVDYTERKRVEEEMLKSRIQLEATNRELESFSYSVSHDLRSPLRGIDGWSLALLEDYGPILDEQGKAHIQKVRTEVQRMGVLIDDILQLSRITRAEMNKEKVDISAIAETVAARLQETKPANRQVEFVIQKGLTAMGDPKLLDVVLTNLLGNAFKFTSKLERSYIEFGRTVVEGKFAFYVRDNGAGFDMTHANKLFGAFQRMHRASEFPGTGIGLATVQRVVIRHGGSIWTSSEVGRGATFYFTLEDNNK